MLTATIILSVLLVMSSYFIIKLARAVFRFEDRIEAALDHIDQSYGVIGEILERPLFYDSPEVREVHNRIAQINNSLLSIAHDLANVEKEERNFSHRFRNRRRPFCWLLSTALFVLCLCPPGQTGKCTHTRRVRTCELTCGLVNV